MNDTHAQVLQQWQEEEAAIRGKLQQGVGIARLEQIRDLSGLETMQAMLAGDLPPPPIAETLDFMLISVAHGEAIFQGRPQCRHYNPLGTVHGGYAATLLDSAMGCAVHTMLEPGLGYTTTDLRISYIRALTRDSGPIRAEGTIVHVGRSTALAEGRLYDVDGRLYATGSTTCLILGR